MPLKSENNIALRYGLWAALARVTLVSVALLLFIPTLAPAMGLSGLALGATISLLSGVGIFAGFKAIQTDKELTEVRKNEHSQANARSSALKFGMYKNCVSPDEYALITANQKDSLTFKETVAKQRLKESDSHLTV